MSYRPSSPRGGRRTNKPVPARGPSRPIDPRYAPGGPPKRRIDTFGIGLITVSSLAALILVAVLLLQNRGTQPSAQVPGAPTPLPMMTATAVAFATQSAPEVLPHITVSETKALYDANDVQIIDVRIPEAYNQGHIKGSVNIPHTTMQTRLAEIPKTGNVVVYCQ